MAPTRPSDCNGDKNLVHYRFCPTCGVRCFLNGTYEVQGQEIDISRIYVSTLDEREDSQPLPELKDIQVKYFSNMDEVPSNKGLADGPHDGGMG